MDDFIYFQGLSEFQLYEKLGELLKSEQLHSLPMESRMRLALFTPKKGLLSTIRQIAKALGTHSKDSYLLGREWFNKTIPSVKESICVHPLVRSLASKNMCTPEVIGVIVEAILSKNDVSVEIATIVAFIIVNRGVNIFCKDYY